MYTWLPPTRIASECHVMPPASHKNLCNSGKRPEPPGHSWTQKTQVQTAEIAIAPPARCAQRCAMLDSSTPAATADPQQPPHTARGHGPGKPFQKGRSGNAAGRSSKPVDVGELARRYARRAIAALVRQLKSDDPQAVVNAARTLLEHGHGAALQQIALHVPRISILCSTNDPEADHADGEATKASRAWDA